MAFCGGVAAIIMVVALVRTPVSPLPDVPLPPLLEAKARAMVIDLETADGRPWRERIVDAASGFVSREVKDGKLSAVVDDALRLGRFDAASTAVVLLDNGDVRDAVCMNMLSASLRACSTLPWGVFAVRGTRTPRLAADMATELAARWHECTAQD